MTTVTIDQSLARKLVETNLAVIIAEIESILKKWAQTSAKTMIERTERGELPEAEVDAIALTNLLEKRLELEELLATIEG
ncbi:MAG: hypothetical protein ACFFB3_21290 [Candidatus Hodarchaeota archaeon]